MNRDIQGETIKEGDRAAIQGTVVGLTPFGPAVALDDPQGTPYVPIIVPARLCKRVRGAMEDAE